MPNTYRMIFILALLVIISRQLLAQAPVAEDIWQLRLKYAGESGINRTGAMAAKWQEYLEGLNEEGQFTDKVAYEKEIVDRKLLEQASFDDQQQMGVFLADAMNLLWAIALHYRPHPDSVPDKYWKAINHYGKIEYSRLNDAHRFHASCFAIPQAANGIYYTFFWKMEAVEKKEEASPLLGEVNVTLKKLAMQSWTQPYRNDETDKNVVQVARFRNHVWWVGGNALAYRPLLPTAAMLKSAAMIDVIAEVAGRSLGNVSQSTYRDAFWIEGFTADGAGWGHGLQSLIWGYPIHGGMSALDLLHTLRGTQWKQRLTRENVDALMNFFRGGSFYYWNGFTPPCLDRYSMVYYSAKSNRIPYYDMLLKCRYNWAESLTPDELQEVSQLIAEAEQNNIRMKNYPAGSYSGTRWFYNNDDLIKKESDYYMMVNMASVRCDGLESAKNFADEYNIFTNDGLTFFQRSGEEYRKIIGAMDITAMPGITAREGQENIRPVTNWRGYCSRFNFAGGATFGGADAAAGFIFQKMHAEEKEKKVDDGSPSAYGVKAWKGYFMIGDYFMALGAGVNNLTPELPGTIRTTIDQTAFNGKLYGYRHRRKYLLPAGKQSFMKNGQPLWVGQPNGFAYTILPGYNPDAFFETTAVNNEWIKRNVTNKGKSDLPVSADILRLWVDHGSKVTNGTYGYVVYAGKGIPPDELPVKVLRNDTLCQCVQSKDQRVTAAVFYSAATVVNTDAFHLGVSAPCVVLIEDKGRYYNVSVADPRMEASLKYISLEINGQKIELALTEGKELGKPAISKLDKQ